MNWPRPTTVTDVCSFLGFTNQYRRFIHKYAHIARPLNVLISGDNANKKKEVLSLIPLQKARLECQDLNCLTVKAIIVGYTTETPLIGTYVGKKVISPQNDTLFCSKVGLIKTFQLLIRNGKIKIRPLPKSKTYYRVRN